MRLLIAKALNGLGVQRGMTADALVNEISERAGRIQLYRNYADGEHRQKLTDEMAQLLRVDRNKSLTQFNANHMGIIIDTMIDRLQVERIQADNSAATEWAAEVLRRNRFDRLQQALHTATVRDGDGYLMAEWSNAEGRVKWTHQPAYDERGGVFALYNEPNTIAAAVKCWTTTREKLGDTVRINVYYSDRIEKFTADTNGGQLERYEAQGEKWPAPWVGRDGQPLGVPIIHYRNRGTDYEDYGMSELADAIPLQDALNRLLYSIIMTSEYGAFPIRTAIGVDPPTGLAPGMWIKVAPPKQDGKQLAPTPDEREWFKSVRFDTLPAASLQPYIEVADWLEAQMYMVTNTPRPAQGNAAESGEAQKQREIRLLGKVRSFQITAGNAWEDALGLSHRIETAFARTAPPAYSAFNTVWRSAELRDDAQVVANANSVRDHIPLAEYYRLLSPVFGWDEERVTTLVQEMEQADTARVARVRSLLPVSGIDDLPQLRQEA